MIGKARWGIETAKESVKGALSGDFTSRRAGDLGTFRPFVLSTVIQATTYACIRRYAADSSVHDTQAMKDHSSQLWRTYNSCGSIIGHSEDASSRMST